MEMLYTKNGILYSGSRPLLLRGMGLGGWLLPEGYMWKFYTKCDRPRRMEELIVTLCGNEYANDFWRRYNNSFITEADIEWIAKQGLNSVRLPLNARHLFLRGSCGDLIFNTDIIALIDKCIFWCKKYQLYLFLDMHGAPGGQTGQNIDDSEADIPELFTDMKHQDDLVEMWRMLAMRYVDEPVVGGYDLLNEPLPEWQNKYNHMLLPLYRRLIKAIRDVDKRHVIILEGAHWATDFSIFDDFTKEEAANNIMLQFHKYWSNPDEESIAPFIEVSKRLNAPLWMGEGGENNSQWYTYVFPMYERLNIGWCFWSYKKMEAQNSPATFSQPDGWDKIIAYLNGGEQPDTDTARLIFDDFLVCISNTQYHEKVVNALLRKPKVVIPAAAFDRERIISTRTDSVSFRTTSKASLLFMDNHTGEPDWRRYNGEPQPDDQRILLHLRQSDAVGYRIDAGTSEFISLTIQGKGNGELEIEGVVTELNSACRILAPDDGMVWITCISQEALLEFIMAEVS